jgi:hypothetical protein
MSKMTFAVSITAIVGASTSMVLCQSHWIPVPLRAVGWVLTCGLIKAGNSSWVVPVHQCPVGVTLLIFRRVHPTDQGEGNWSINLRELRILDQPLAIQNNNSAL